MADPMKDIIIELADSIGKIREFDPEHFDTEDARMLKSLATNLLNFAKTI